MFFGNKLHIPYFICMDFGHQMLSIQNLVLNHFTTHTYNYKLHDIDVCMTDIIYVFSLRFKIIVCSFLLSFTRTEMIMGAYKFQPNQILEGCAKVS